VPIFRYLLKQYRNNDILEIGNVLSHYQKIAHKIIDKYEKAPNVINIDICDYKDESLYDCIYSISTFEHIGNNRYETTDGHKVYEAIDHVMKMLKPGGVFMFSFIVGFNPVMDTMIRDGKLNFKRSYYYKCIDGKWLNIDKSMFKYDYDKSSREVFIGIIKKP
jgi:cyclopropane fatty-acyl-phospholipid synthase-like methyltransferase